MDTNCLNIGTSLVPPIIHANAARFTILLSRFFCAEIFRRRFGALQVRHWSGRK